MAQIPGGFALGGQDDGSRKRRRWSVPGELYDQTRTNAWNGADH